MAKIREKLLKGGSVVTKNKKTRFEASNEERNNVKVELWKKDLYYYYYLH